MKALAAHAPRLLVVLVALALASCEDKKTTVPVLVVAPVSGSDEGDAVALDDALAILGETLAAMGHEARVERVAAGEYTQLAARLAATLTIVVDADRLGLVTSTIGPVADLDARFDDRFAIDLGGDDEARVVMLSSRSRLARFYAIYELLRRFGARYYHPEEAYLPRVPLAELTRRAALPTALGDGPIFTPDFVHRSYSFHGAHPLEHLEAFSDRRHPIDEALRVNDWIIQNRGDLFRGAGRGIARGADRSERVAELEAFRLRRGLRRGAGITLHNQQQGASADIDRNSDEPIPDQIQRVVAEALGRVEDAYNFGIHFGPTELTTTPDLETIEWIELAGNAALALRPDLQIEINDHTTGSQPVEHFDDLGCPPGTNDDGKSDYYDLAFHTDPRFGVKVHTVMFHPLEGPAGVYQQESFAHKLCLMQKASAQGRPLVWFPEGAYWLSWDNAIPVYLPLYLYTRHRDVELLRPLLRKNGGTLADHRMFNSGHEWGYWQQDYAVGLLHWNAEIGLEAILGELADPLCAPDAYRTCPARATYVEVLTEVIALQAEAFLTAPDFRGRPGGLYTYFAGEDPADELGARSGLEFRPVRIAFRDVLNLSDAERDAFTAIDLAELRRLGDAFAAAAARLSGLSAEVPADGRPWLAEVIDGLEVNALRARHTHALYQAVLALGRGGPEDAELADALAVAAHHLDEARVVVARREAAYRYPLPQLIGGGLTPETALENGTTYPYRVHTKTHLMSYWENRQAQVADLVAGRADDGDGVALTPVIAAPGTPVAITWPALDQLSGTLEMGDGSAIDTAAREHVYATAGVFEVSGLLETSGAPLPVSGVIARTDVRLTVAQGGFHLDSPDSDLARSVLASLVPPLRLALDLDGARAALLAEPGGRDSARFDEVVALTLEVADDAIAAGPFSFALPIPDPSSGATAAEIGLSGLALTITRDGDALGPATLGGELSVDDLVTALVELAGFEATGARQTLAGVLGFDPEEPPETVTFSATLALTVDP